MNQEKYIAAIEISSSKIVGAVGRHTPAGRLEVIAVETEHAVECVCNGLIHNVEETATRISRIIERLEHRTGISPRRITKVYVGLGGRSLRNVPREIVRNLPEDTEITEDILSSIADEAARSQIDSSLEVLEALPASYMVNKTETKSPAGTFGNNIRVKYQLVAARPMLRRHLERVVREKVGLDIARIVVTPVAVGRLVLSDEERRLGCMLVDMGAETTTVSIYQKGALHYLAVLPMGSRNITRDITSLSVLEKEAEDTKVSSGSAIYKENAANLNINNMRLSDVYHLVVARSEELVANIIQQITYASLTPAQLPAGIITVGGGFNLARMGELLARNSDMKVRRAKLPEFVTLEDTKAPSYECIEVISIMSAGTAQDAPQCLEMPMANELPPDEGYTDEDWEQEDLRREEQRREKERRRRSRRSNSTLDWVKRRLAGMFSEPEDGDTEIADQDS